MSKVVDPLLMLQTVAQNALTDPIVARGIPATVRQQIGSAVVNSSVLQNLYHKELKKDVRAALACRYRVDTKGGAKGGAKGGSGATVANTVVKEAAKKTKKKKKSQKAD
jgi:hypothetical protein